MESTINYVNKLNNTNNKIEISHYQHNTTNNNINKRNINYCNDISVVISWLWLLNGTYLALHTKCHWFESYLLPFGIKYLFSY